MKFNYLLFSLLISMFGKSQIDFTHNWSHGFGDISNEQLRGSTVDASGNLLITGKFDGTIDFDPGPGVTSYTESGKAYIAKYNAAGALQWVNVLTGTGFSFGDCVDVDAASNVYVSGHFNGGEIDFDPGVGTATLLPQTNDMYIAKYNSSGVFQWVQRIGNLSAVVSPIAMKVTGAGDIHITGGFNMSVDFDAGAGVNILNASGNDAFLTKYDNAGNFVWAFKIGDTGTDYGFALDVNAAGEIALTGQFEATPDFDPSVVTNTITSYGAEDLFAAKYSGLGSLIWVGTMGGTAKDLGTSVKFASTGDVILSGAIQSTSFDNDPTIGGINNVLRIGFGPSNDIYLGRLTGATGTSVWGKITGAALVTGDAIARSIALDAQNNIYLTGSFEEVVDFDINIANSFTMQPLSSPAADVFLAKYDYTDANFIYAKQMGGGTNNGNQAGFVLLNAYSVFVTGEHGNALDMDPGVATSTINSYGGSDFFISKYTECNLPVMTGITGPPPACSGSNFTISITGTLNQAANWQWYSGSCGGPTVGTGTAIVVSPTVNTNYFVRGVGGCAPGGMSCFNSSVIVNPLTNIVGQVTTNTAVPVPVSGSVTLYRYETQFTKFDSITTVALDAMGNYTILSAPTSSYIVKAIPTATNQIITYAPSAISWKGASVFTHGCAVASTQNVNVIGLANFGPGPGMLTGKVVQGLKYGQKGAGITAPGNPIKGISVKGGRNPGGNIGAQDMTGPSGSYTLGGLMMSGVGETYFILVDIAGLDTNGTYHKVIAVGTETFTQLDFVVDSAKIHPMIFVGVKEEKFENNSVKVFPNPTNGKLFIELELDKPCDVKIELLDMMGKNVETILPSSYQESKQTTIISNLKKHHAGIYFINIVAGANKKTSKIIISE